MTNSKTAYRSEISRLVNQLSKINQEQAINGDRAGLYRWLNNEIGVSSIKFASSRQLEQAIQLLQYKIEPEPEPIVYRHKEVGCDMTDILSDMLITTYGIVSFLRKTKPEHVLELDFIVKNMTSIERRIISLV